LKARVTGVGEQQAETAVDFSVLEAYAVGDRTLVREVLTVFCGEAMEWSRRLQGEDWRAVVHTIKGTARTIGARRLGELCEQAEEDGQNLAEVRAELDAALRAINDYLARRGP
jgi:HPt (histidine-containing phosphotransfer) domain-containing protein